MPPKKRDKEIYLPEKDNLPEGITMPAVAATPTTPERLIKVSRQRTFDVNPEPKYVSPLKKLRKTMSVQPHQLFDTIDSLREFISKNDMTNPEIRSSARIRAHLLWTTAETVRGLHFLRLYLGEAQALEPLKDQQKEYQEAQSQDPFTANQFLITMSLYEIDRRRSTLAATGERDYILADEATSLQELLPS